MNSFRNLEEYYNKLEVKNIFLPNNPQFRQWKFFLENGVVMKIRRKIRRKEILKKLFCRYYPIAVYYSTSCFLNPHRIKYKKKKCGFDCENLIISNDICIDVDSKELNLGGLENAKIQTLKIYNYLKDNDYEIIYCSYSGRGFHILAKSKDDLPKKISERVEYIENERKKLVKELKEKRFSFDQNVTLDSYRVIRLINSPNMKVGKIVTLLEPSDLQLPIKTLLSRVDYIGNMLGIPERGNDKRLIRNALETDRANIRSSPFFTQFATSKVGKLKRFVLFLKYDKKLENVEKDLKRLQKIYNLPDFYIFVERKSAEEFPIYYCVCLKTMQLRRIQKIINNSTSIDTNKFKLHYIQVSDMIWQNGEIYRKKPEYEKTIKSECRKDYVSKPHLTLLENIFDVPIENPNKCHGNDLCIIPYRGKLNG